MFIVNYIRFENKASYRCNIKKIKDQNKKHNLELQKLEV